jgi:hypothetical protein
MMMMMMMMTMLMMMRKMMMVVVVVSNDDDDNDDDDDDVDVGAHRLLRDDGQRRPHRVQLTAEHQTGSSVSSPITASRFVASSWRIPRNPCDYRAPISIPDLCMRQVL